MRQKLNESRKTREWHDMDDRLIVLLTAYKDALQLANALYGMYRDQRDTTDSYASQIREAIKRKPLTEKDWRLLKEKVEKE